MKSLVVINPVHIYARITFTSGNKSSGRFPYSGLLGFSKALSEAIMWCVDEGTQDFAIIDTRMTNA